jgi:hypothetical protein
MLLGEVRAEAEEVDDLARRVDLGLERGLALAEHGRRVELGPPRAGEQVRGLEEDRARSSQGMLRPLACAASSGRDRPFDLLGAGPVRRASTWPWACGMTTSNVSPVRISSPPMTSGMSTTVPDCASSSAIELVPLGAPGA